MDIYEFADKRVSSLCKRGIFSHSVTAQVFGDVVGAGTTCSSFGRFNRPQYDVKIGILPEFDKDGLDKDSALHISLTVEHERVHILDEQRLLRSRSYSDFDKHLAMSFLATTCNIGMYHMGYDCDVTEMHANICSLQSGYDAYVDVFGDENVTDMLINIWKHKSSMLHLDFFADSSKLDEYTCMNSSDVVGLLRSNMLQKLNQVLSGRVPAPCRYGDVVYAYLQDFASDEFVDCWRRASSQFERNVLAAAINASAISMDGVHELYLGLDESDFVLERGSEVFDAFSDALSHQSRNKVSRKISDFMTDADMCQLLRDNIEPLFRFSLLPEYRPTHDGAGRIQPRIPAAPIQTRTRRHGTLRPHLLARRHQRPTHVRRQQA